ncbi:MAG: hypothetical protein BGO07_03855 [Alphaproteobacteria bacterium 40-19]|nr:MAG: hypothetical protein BGO07_03855 [Alphaproteobacteria bacterium 40-19]
MGLLRSILNVVLPLTCAYCHKVLESRGLCSHCWKRFVYLTGSLCQRCGEPLDPFTQHALCAQCTLSPPFFHKHRSVWTYNTYSKYLIMQFKHGHQQWLIPFLGQMMLSPLWQLSVPYNGIVPVPLHWKKLAQRGFNQAALLACWLGRHTGIPVFVDGLIRIRQTPSQGIQSRKKRTANVQNAFELGSLPITVGSKILLIDDVFTTGATLNACSQTLFQAGVKEIGALTLAKVLIPETSPSF